jgi:hypothetical protein
MTLPEVDSGVPDTSRSSLRFKFFLSALLGGAFAGATVFFLLSFAASDFSGAGHSTSRERSIRSAEIHSSRRLLNSS